MSEFPPGPDPPSNPIDFVRYFRDIGSDILGFTKDRFDRYGDFYYAPLRSQHLFVTRNPEHFEEVLITHNRSFEKTTGGFAAKQLTKLLGNGLVLANGDTWRRHRRMINPAMSRKRISSYAKTIVSFTERMLDGWRTGQIVDMHREMTELTLRIVTKALFDHDAGPSVDRVSDAMDAFRDFSNFGMVLPDWVPWPANIRFDRALAEVDEIIATMVAERRRLPDDELAERDDLLSMLVLATDEEGDGEAFTPEQLRDELITMFFAGHETTASALTWTFYLLSQNPEVVEWISEELSALEGPATKDDFKNLPRTRAAFEEAMRIYPPVSLVSRTATEDVEIGGYVVPEGAEILCWFYWSHHDERWFEQPETYRPQRFIDDTDRPRLAYMPFGAGQRTCIGKYFALMEGVLILATVLRDRRLEYMPSKPPVPSVSVTMVPRDGMPMRVQ